MAGILGAGGAAFPAHIKYARPADTIIINGAECEPLAQKDYTILQLRPADIVSAAAVLRDELGAREIVLAVKAARARALAGLFGGLKFHALPDVYPAGDEAVLVYEVTGRRVPAAGIPPDVGVCVSNVETVLNVARALRGKPVLTKWVTVAGAVYAPFTAEVPLGAPAAWLLESAGGLTSPDDVVFNGGPMMGEVIDVPTFGVGPATTMVLALPAGHVAVERYLQPLAHVRTIAGSACTQCRDCTEMCPRYLLGYDVTPHLSMRRYYAWGGDAGGEWFANAAGCTGCGVCELYACPMAISPRRVQMQLKKAGLCGPRTEGMGEVHADRPGRQIPAGRLKKRLDLSAFSDEAPYRECPDEPRAVIISLNQPYGGVLEVKVSEGDTVKRGDLLAAPAAADTMAVPVYASISGRISGFNATGITIDRTQAA